MLWRAQTPAAPSITIPGRVSRGLWILAGLDIVAVALMIAAGSWLDHASKITAVITLGGRHLLVLGLALLGFSVLAALGVLTKGFDRATQLHLALIALGSAISILALAGALVTLLMLVIGGVVLGLVAGLALLRR